MNHVNSIALRCKDQEIWISNCNQVRRYEVEIGPAELVYQVDFQQTQQNVDHEHGHAREGHETADGEFKFLKAHFSDSSNFEEFAKHFDTTRTFDDVIKYGS